MPTTPNAGGRFAAGFLAALAPGPGLAQTMNRLKGVSQHARERSAEGPEHLWVGVVLVVALAGVVSLAAWWTLGRRAKDRRSKDLRDGKDSEDH